MPEYLDGRRVNFEVFDCFQGILPHEQQMTLAALCCRACPGYNILVIRAEDRIRMRIQRRKA